MVLRASDDIKDSVRAAAAGALRTLRSVTLRLADPAASPPTDAAAAVALMLPFLLQTGGSLRSFLTSNPLDGRPLPAIHLDVCFLSIPHMMR